MACVKFLLTVLYNSAKMFRNRYSFICRPTRWHTNIYDNWRYASNSTLTVMYKIINNL